MRIATLQYRVLACRPLLYCTTTRYTNEAIAYAKQMDVKIILIDGEDLAQYMIDNNLGVSIQSTYEIKKIDSDYFEEE